MKKIQILLIVILCLTFSIINGFSSQRYNLWNNRLKTLNVQKSEILKDNKNWESVIALLNNDIERAKKILMIIDSKNGEKGSSKYKNKKYNKLETGEFVRTKLDPLFSFYYFEYLVKQIGERGTYQHAVKVVHDFLETSAKEHFGSIDEDILKEIVYENINKTDWKYLTMEILLGRIIRSKEKIFEKVAADIEKEVEIKLARRDYIISPEELYAVVTSCFDEYFEKFNINNNLGFSQEALLESWSWHGIHKGVLKIFKHHKEIISMYQEYDDITFDKVHSSYDKPEELEQPLFEAVRKEHLDLRPLKNDGVAYEKKEQNQYVANIPEDPKITELFNDMDSIRKISLTRISGKEKEKFFDKLEKKFNITIDKYLKDTKNKFKQEDKRLIAAIEKIVLGIVQKAYGIASNKNTNGTLDPNKHKLTILNENEFKEAKSIFKDKISHVNQYKQKSIKFLKCISGARKISKDKIFEANKRYADRNFAYMNFVSSQIRKLSEIKNQPPAMQKRFLTIMRRTNNLINAIGYSIRLAKSDSLQLNDKEYEEVKNTRAQVASFLKKTKSEIKKVYSDMKRNQEKARIRLIASEADMKDKIAIMEAGLVHEKILELKNLYKKQRYADKAFKYYLDTYNELLKEAKSGKTSPLLDNAINRQSLFGLNKSIDQEKIKFQYEIKKYIKAEIGKDISTLIILLRSCKRKRIKLDNSQKIIEDIALIKNEIRTATDVTVGRWKIKELNFIDVDKKVVKLLIQIRNREFLKSANINNIDNNTQKRISLEKLGISLVIPYGWEKDDVLDSANLNKGIMKSFKSLDGSFQLYIARVIVEGKDASEITGQWIKMMKNRSIKGKWGRKKDINYFWTVSIDKKKNIMEVYTVPRGKQAFVLAGITSRGKYKYFKNKISSIFQSIKIDIKLTSSAKDKRKALKTLQGI